MLPRGVNLHIHLDTVLLLLLTSKADLMNSRIDAFNHGSLKIQSLHQKRGGNAHFAILHMLHE